MYTARQIKEKLESMTDEQLDTTRFIAWYDLSDVEFELDSMEFEDLTEEQKERLDGITDEEELQILDQALADYSTRRNDNDTLDVFIREEIEKFVLV